MVNMERLLHRGKYAVSNPGADEYQGRPWLKIAGITREFSKSDRFLAIFLVAWNALFFLWFVVFSIINLFYPISDAAWATYWHVNILILVVLAMIATTAVFAASKTMKSTIPPYPLKTKLSVWNHGFRVFGTSK